MTSQDNQQFITAEIFKSELGDIRTEMRSGFERIDKEFKDIHSEIQAVKDIAIVNSAKIDAYKDFTSIWFTIIAIIVALIGFLGTIAPLFRDIYKDSKKNKSQENIREIAREVMHDEINSAVLQAFNNLNK